MPFFLLLIIDETRGLKEAWPAALTIGDAFAIAQWWSATHFSDELTDVVAALAALAATDVSIPRPGLDGRLLNDAGEPVTTTVHSFQWLSSPGTLLLITGLLVAIIYSVFNGQGRFPLSMGNALAEIGRAFWRLRGAALETGLDPYLTTAANTSGGVVGKMISPQSLAIAATAVGMEGKESAIFRSVIWWSVGLLLLLCTIVFLQSNVLSWMLPGA